MVIYIDDDNNKISEETFELMKQSVCKAVDTEFETELSDKGLKASDLPLELSLTVVDAEEIKTLNGEYRGIDKVTDVLSFPQFADNEELLEDILEFGASDESVLLGDVVICYDKAMEQAEEYGTGIKRELIYLFVHSVFHLMGYDHELDEDKIEMRTREEEVMDAIGIPRRVD